MKNKIEKTNHQNIDSFSRCVSDDKSLTIESLVALRGGDGDGSSGEQILPPPPPPPPPFGN